jgi:TRAP transporter TAXI family solute receptor
MYPKWVKWWLLAGVWISLTWISGVPAGMAASGEIPLFRIGTGGPLGVYYPIGQALALGFSSAQTASGRVAVAQTSGGSVANVRALASGEIEAGMVQADVAFQAQQGTGLFSPEQKKISLKAIASLYPERLQVLVRQDANIRRFKDLRKKTVSLDESGSGTLAAMRIALEFHGLKETDLDPVYLKPEFTVERLARGRLDGISLMAGTPAPAILQIVGPGFFMVPIDPGITAAIHRKHPYFLPGVIPDGIYPGIPETPTLEVYALLLVREDIDADLVYDLTRILWSDETRALLRKAHPLGDAVTMKTALHGLTVGLHPGAIRFYRHQERLPKGDAIP